MPLHRPARETGASRKGTLLMIAFALACVGVPALFFYQTWYGVRLGDAQLEAYLADDASARQHRHAIEEITHRLQEGRGDDHWLAELVRISRDADPAVRFAAAWAMQEDATHPDLQARLLELLEDDSAIVRRNAATSLARGGSIAGRTVLHAMLASSTVVAPRAGAVEYVIGQGERATAGRPLARIELGDEELVEVRASVPGPVARVLVAAGDTVEAGQELVILGIDEQHAFNAATALALVGTAEDRAVLRAALGPQSGLGDDVRRQIEAALAALDQRAK